jgi:hypothetical protein
LDVAGAVTVIQVLDIRVYRAAFLPALVAVFVAAFSLQDRPAPSAAPLTADAFDGVRALEVLNGLDEAFPDRRPGSAGDRALADRIATALAREDAVGRPGFKVTRTTTEATRRDLGPIETVVGVRPGLSSRRVVVLAERDAPGLAGLSASAGMLELARVLRARDTRKTLVLVSTSGATTGHAGAAAWARDAEAGQTDAVLVLGDLGGAESRRPWVVPWSGDAAPVPLALQRTAEAALRQEAGTQAGGAHATGQWARRAVPFTVSGQGVLRDAGLPALAIGVSGERGPARDTAVRERRIEAYGRAALRTLTAVDAAGDPFAQGPHGIVVMRNVLPDWAVRLLVMTLALPALLTALDAFFRARRRGLPVGPWLFWLGLAALPVIAAWAWARALGLAGGVDAPPAPVPAGAIPLERGGWAALASVAVVLAVCWFGVRPLLARRLDLRGGPAAGSLAAATALVLALTVLAVWIFNPYAAALLVPAAHVWLFAAAPHVRLRRWPGALAIAAGLALPVALVVHYATALGTGPFELAWLVLLAVASGSLGVPTALTTAAFAACLAGAVTAMRARRRVAEAAPAETIRTRGPLGYAGPGSLGGTESALRR